RRDGCGGGPRPGEREQLDVADHSAPAPARPASEARVATERAATPAGGSSGAAHPRRAGSR
ncbi:MAG: hypothetical protein M5U28_15220, partial [Sandaracinaceae bacterium]|nr:hypothetical protein [Sandaracinaceae bacterium]